MKRILQICFVVVLTGFFLGLFLWKSNLHQVGAILAGTDLRWFVVGMLVNFSAMIFRSLRWRIILNPDQPPAFYSTFFANCVGYMLSTVLPVRAGDVVRPALLARRSNIRFASALGTVLTERVIDFIAVLSIFVAYCAYHWNDYAKGSKQYAPWLVIKSATTIGSLLLGGMILMIIGIYFFSPTVRRMHEWLGGLLPHRFREPWMIFFDVFVQSLEITRNRKALAGVTLATIGVWTALTTQFYFGSLAVGRPLPVAAGCLLGGATTVGIAIPTPGGVGGFHKIAQWVLTSFYSFDIDSSVATAIIFHLIGALPVIISGVLLFAVSGLRWRDVTSAPEEGGGERGREPMKD